MADQAQADAAARSLATKEYASLLIEIPLLKDIGFHKFKNQLFGVAHHNGWAPSVLDNQEALPGDLTVKQRCDMKNAFRIIQVKTMGSPVEHKISVVTLGDSRAAWKAVRDYFIKATALGRSTASTRFHNATMQSTGKTVVEWAATVTIRAQDLEAAGGTASRADMASVYLRGLLTPTFGTIQSALETNEPTVPDDDDLFMVYQRKVEDYARAKGYLEATNGSGASGNRTFTIDGNNRKVPPHIDPNEQCKMWTQGRCRYGANCYRKHDGPGGVAPNAWTDKPQKKPKVVCQFCQEKNHILADCSKFRAVSTPSLTSGQASASGQAPSTPAGPRLALSSANFVNLPQQASSRPAQSAVNFVELPQQTTSESEQKPSFIYNLYSEPEPTNELPMNEDEDSTTDYHNYEVYAAIVLLFIFLATNFQSVMNTASKIAEQPLFASAAVITAILLAGSAGGGNERQRGQAWQRFLTALLIFSAYLFGAAAHPNPHIASMSYHVSPGRPPSFQHYEWCADCGTNRFVTNDINDFVPGSICNEPTIVAVGGGNVTSPCTGTVIVKSLDYGHLIECTDVIYLPKCAKKLMPASNFTKKGCSMTISDKGEVHLIDKVKGPVLSGIEIGGLFYYHCQTVHSSSLNSPKPQKDTVKSKSLFGLEAGKSVTSASSKDFPQRLYEQHLCFGHLNFTKLRKLLKLPPAKPGDDPTCPACTVANQKQQPLSDHPHSRSTRPCHRMWMDLGFTAGCRYKFQLSIDDFTRESWIDIIDSKDEVLPRWIELKSSLENDYQPWKFAFIKTDMEAIYCTPAWDQHCKENGIIHEHSNAYKHGQLGVAERAMQSIGCPFRAMMLTANAPEKLIPYCLRFANVVRNNSPTKANKGLTPLEKKLGKKLTPNHRLFKAPWGSLCFGHIYADQRAKHGRRGIACMYLGYDPVNNSYLIMEWGSGRICYHADVEFFPTIFPCRANPQPTLASVNRYDDLAPYSVDLIPDQENAQLRQSVRQKGYQFSDGVAIASIPDEDIPPDPMSLVIHNWGPEPTTYEEAMALHDADQWILADLIEKEQFKALDVFETVPRSHATRRGKRIFKFKEVFKRKMNPPDEDNPLGSLDKHKFRLTIAAYTNSLREGIDYKEKNASTVRWTTIKILLAVAVKFDLDLTLIDISTFFLYGDLDEEVYMEFPSRWAEDDESPPDYIWRLKKGVYGWPSASNGAQKKLNSVLVKNKVFKQSPNDDCVYTLSDSSKNYCTTGTWVDDLFTIGNPEGTSELIKTLEAEFKITVIKNPTSVTGVELIRNREKKWAKLHQCEFTTNLLKDYKMLDSQSVSTPIDPGITKAVMMLPQDQFTPQSVNLYQKLLGRLIWLCCRTRPDLTYVINFFSRFVRCASDKHYNHLRGRPLRYLNGSRDHGIVFYPGTGEWILYGSSDADLAGDTNSSRSVLSTHSQLGEYGNVHASTCLERKICTSTGQAETYAFFNLLKEIFWERNLLSDLGFPQKKPTTCYCDNDGVIIQSTKVVNHAAAKHYRISQAFIRQVCGDGIARSAPIASVDNSSDLGTKPLLPRLFLKHRLQLMGPQDNPDKSIR